MSSIHTHSERSARTGIAIVWPANFPGSTDPELHATALFLGNTDTVDFSTEDIEEALGPSYLWPFLSPGWVKVTGTAMFGRNLDVPVLTLEHNNLMTVSRDSMKRRLYEQGIRSNDQFGFNPHVTIAKEPLHPAPREGVKEIHLEPPVLWWGEERATHSERVKAAA